MNRYAGRRQATVKSLLGAAAQLAGKIAEEAEEFAVGRQDHGGVIAAEGFAIGLHGALEGEELDILAERLGEDAAERMRDFGGLLQVDGESYKVAFSFRKQLRSHVESPENQVYVFPSAANEVGERLLSIDAFPLRKE